MADRQCAWACFEYQEGNMRILGHCPAEMLSKSRSYTKVQEFDSKSDAIDYELYRTIQSIRELGMRNVKGHIFRHKNIIKKNFIRQVLSYGKEGCENCGSFCCQLGKCEFSSVAVVYSCFKCGSLQHKPEMCEVSVDYDCNTRSDYTTFTQDDLSSNMSWNSEYSLNSN